MRVSLKVKLNPCSYISCNFSSIALPAYIGLNEIHNIMIDYYALIYQQSKPIQSSFKSYAYDV